MFDVLLVLLVLTSMGVVVTQAQTNYALMKPFIASISPQANEVKIQIVQAGLYNPSTDRYENMTIALRNFGNGNTTVTVTVQFLSTDKMLIASSQKVVVVAPQETLHISMILTWYGNYTLRDYADGKVTAS